MLVRTKTADIAILRTMGATRGAILRLFLLDGLAIGGVGAIGRRRAGARLRLNIEAIRQWLQHTFGLVLFDETLYLLAEMPSHITWQEVATIAGMAMVSRWRRRSIRRARPAGSIRSRGCAVSDAGRDGSQRAVERGSPGATSRPASAKASSPSFAIFSLIGIALGVATLIIVLSVMGGFPRQPDQRLIGMNGHVVIPHARHAADHARAAGVLRASPDVKAVRLTWSARPWSPRRRARPAAPCCAACGWRT
jgi:ABC-type lipoprotein release transport system permease subunit